MNRSKRIIVIIAAVLLVIGAALPALAQDSDERDVVKIVAQSEEFADWLAQYEGWQGAAYYSEEDGGWYVEFYDEAGEEWLGYANVVDGTNEITEAFAPKPLPPDEFQAGQERIHTLVMEDPEVLARLVDPLLWDIYVEYNRWDEVWEVWMSRGVDTFVVRASYSEEEGWFNIDEIADANALEEETAVQAARDEAITMAYEADGSGEALNAYDDWHTYTEQQGQSIWSVSFVTSDGELFYALVDVERDVVLETSAP